MDVARVEAPEDRDVLRECLKLWGIAIAGVLFAKVVLDPLLGPPAAAIGLGGLFHPKTAAALLFLYLPLHAMKKRGEYAEDYGANFRHWPRSLMLFAGMVVVTFPLFIAGYVAFLKLLVVLPKPLASLLAPYGPRVPLLLRLPERPILHAFDQLLVVALPEEFFYRGYLQQRLKLRYGPGRRALGISVGAAFFVTQGLFALGHLVEPYPWRLAVFFPALLFGWLRERSGGLLAGVLFHAACNLLMMTLEASFLGG